MSPRSGKKGSSHIRRPTLIPASVIPDLKLEHKKRKNKPTLRGSDMREWGEFGDPKHCTRFKRPPTTKNFNNSIFNFGCPTTTRPRSRLALPWAIQGHVCVQQPKIKTGGSILWKKLRPTTKQPHIYCCHSSPLFLKFKNVSLYDLFLDILYGTILLENFFL